MDLKTNIEIVLDSTDALRGADILEKRFLSMGAKVEDATKRIGSAFDKLAKKIENSVTSLDASNSRMSRSTTRATHDIQSMGTAADRAAASFDRLVTAQNRLLMGARQMQQIGNGRTFTAGYDPSITTHFNSVRGPGAFPFFAGAAVGSTRFALPSPRVPLQIGPGPIIDIPGRQGGVRGSASGFFGGGGGVGGGGAVDADGASAGRAAGAFDRLAQAALGYFSVTQAIRAGRALIDAEIQLQQIENTMSAVTGSATQTAGEIAFIRRESDRLGMSFVDVASAYAKFSAATKSTSLEGRATKDIFTAVAETSRRLSLTGDQTAHIFLALEQMASKGVVSMEELRRQMGNYLPGAFQIAARAMGVTTSEFDKMVRSGEVLATDLIPKLAQQLRQELPAADSVNSTAAAVERLKNAFFDLKTTLASGPAGAVTRGAMSSITETIKDWTTRDRAFRQWSKEEDYSKEFGGVGRFNWPFVNNYLSKDREFKDQLERIQSMELTLNANKERNRLSGVEFGPQPLPAMSESQLKDLAALEKVGREAREFQVTGFQRQRMDARNDYLESESDLSKRINNLGFHFSDEQRGKAKLDIERMLDQRLAGIDNAESEQEASRLSSGYRDLNSLQLQLRSESLGPYEAQLERIKQQYDEIALKLIVMNHDQNVPEEVFGFVETARSRATDHVNRQRKFAEQVANLGSADFNTLIQRRDDALRHRTGLSPEENANIIYGSDAELARRFESGNVTGRQGLSFGFKEAEREFGNVGQRMAQIGATTAQSIQASFDDGFTSILTGSKDFGQAITDIFSNIGLDITRVLFKTLVTDNVTQTILKSLGSLSMFGGTGSTSPVGTVTTATASYAPGTIAAWHRGGVVGADSAQAVQVPANAFDFAPRYHSGKAPGLRSNEQAAVVENGEGVFTQEQMKALGTMGRSQGQKVEIINSVDPRMVDKRLAENPRLILNVIADNAEFVRRIVER